MLGGAAYFMPPRSPTFDKLRDLNLFGMARALEQLSATLIEARFEPVFAIDCDPPLREMLVETTFT